MSQINWYSFAEKNKFKIIEEVLEEYIDYSGHTEEERETPEQAYDYLSSGGGKQLREDVGIILSDLEEWENERYDDWVKKVGK